MHEDIIDNYIKIYNDYGEEKLFKHTIGNGILISTQIAYPEIIILDHSDEFFILYRKTGDIQMFEIGRILRRASHKIYREFSKIYKKNSLDYPVNDRFLNIIR